MVFVSCPRFHRIIIQVLLAPKPLKQLQAKIVATDSLKICWSHFQWSTVPRLLLLPPEPKTLKLVQKLKTTWKKQKHLPKSYLNYVRDTRQNYLKD
jgi:hypothetical protein